jgi:MFS family permease
MTSAGNYGQVLAGRFVMGLGIGQTTVVAPAYLAEAAPRSIRGLCICIFSGSVYLGIMLGYFVSDS